MIDPKLDKQVNDVKELLLLWRKFHEFFVLGVKSSDISGDHEQQFLELKSRIAMLSDTFLEALTHDHNIGQHVLSLVERAITLRHLSKLSVAEVKKMEIEWHEAYLLLNETVGILSEKQESLSKVSPSKYQLKKAITNSVKIASGMVTGLHFKVFVGMLILVVAFGALPKLGIIDYSKLGEYKYTKSIYSSLKKTYRKTFGGQIPYDDFSELEINTSKRSERNIKERGVSSVTLTQMANEFQYANIHQDLMKAQQFKSEDFQYQNQPVRLLFFRYKTISEADQVVKKFNDWVSNNQDFISRVPFSPVAMSEAFNKLNIAVFVISPSMDARLYFKQEEFGVGG